MAEALVLSPEGKNKKETLTCKELLVLFSGKRTEPRPQNSLSFPARHGRRALQDVAGRQEHQIKLQSLSPYLLHKSLF